MSLKGCALGLVCVGAGLSAGGVVGFCAGVNQAAHESSAGWFDTRGLDVLFGVVIGAVVGGLIGCAVKAIARLMGAWEDAVVLAFLLIAIGIGGSSLWRYNRAWEDSLAQYQQSINNDAAARAKQRANYELLMGNSSALQYPGAHLWPRRAGDPYSMTAGDTPQSVANYYQRILGTPLAGSACGVGPSLQCWSAWEYYQGVPLHITISDDDLNDGGKASIIISASDDASVRAASVPSAAPSSPNAAPPVAPTQPPADPKAAQHAKIVKLRAELAALTYPGARENPDGDPSMILNLTTADPVDTVGAYYRDHLGFALRQVQGKDAMVWFGDVVHDGVPFRLAIFVHGGVTNIQMT